MSAPPAPTLAADPLLPRTATVVRRIQETADTWTLVLEPEGGWPFAPGQFDMLYAFGVGEVPISISGDPGHRGEVVHTIKDVGPVTRALCALEEGATLALRGPYGRGWPGLDALNGKDVVIVAGGIGLAPLRPTILALLAERERFGRVVLCIGARSPGDLLFPTSYTGWQAAGAEVDVTVDHAGLDWTGHVGVVTTVLDPLQLDPGRTRALICGPEVMIRFAARSLLRMGVAAEHVFVSLERNMHCAVGLCGRCQLGPEFVCADGPVFDYAQARPLLAVREL